MLPKLILDYFSVRPLHSLKVFEALAHLRTAVGDQDPGRFDIGFDIFNDLGDKFELRVTQVSLVDAPGAEKFLIVRPQVGVDEKAVLRTLLVVGKGRRCHRLCKFCCFRVLLFTLDLFLQRATARITFWSIPKPARDSHLRCKSICSFGCFDY